LGVGATALAYAVGIAIGLLAGYSRTLIDPILMRGVDVLLGVPALLILLIVLLGAGRNPVALVLAVAMTQIPWIARIVRVATLEVSVRQYVESAVARGERTLAILWREILPNIMNVILADAGIRFTRSLLLIAAVNFLGVGLQPPAADWALMVSENRLGLSVQLWAAVVPALLIALLTVSANVIADGVADSLGVSSDAPRQRPDGG
jgi:ABC-type dipeptide/oligopeptide/nickel transport system permease subunit